MSGLAALDIGTLFSLVEKETRLGLAVSGGADSLALLLLAHEWATPRGVELFVYSVDHGLRAEAAEEAAMVKRQAEQLGHHARILRWSGQKPQTGVQAAARDARYRLIGAAMEKDGVRVLLTAHHRDDQAETVLMRMAHGSGIEGLRGMLPSSLAEGNIWIVRPLLDVGKAELEQVVADAGLTPAQDPSNADTHYERVRWRAIMPQLEALGLDSRRLAKLASRAAEANEAIESAAAAAIAKYQNEPHIGMDLPLSILSGVPAAVGIRTLGRALAMTGKAGKSRDLSGIEQLFARLVGGPVKPLTLHGCVVASDGETVSIRREGARKTAPKTRKTETAS